MLNTVKRLRNGIALGSSPSRSARSAFLVGHEAVRIDDRGAVLALADIAAEAERLAESEPALAGKAALDDGAPEDQHVDPGIAALVAAFFGMASDAFAAAVPQGWTQGTRPASSSAMILSVIS